jgi:hypothetical protein
MFLPGSYVPGKSCLLLQIQEGFDAYCSRQVLSLIF